MDDIKEELVNLANETREIYKKLDELLESNEIDITYRFMLNRIKIDMAHNEFGLKELSKLM